MDSSQAKLGLVANTAREPRDSSRNLGLIARESRAVSQAKLGIHHERNLGFITNETWNSPQTKLGIHHTNDISDSSQTKLGSHRQQNLEFVANETCIKCSLRACSSSGSTVITLLQLLHPHTSHTSTPFARKPCQSFRSFSVFTRSFGL